MDKASITLGFLVGQQIAGQMRKTEEKTPIAYLYNGVQLPALPEWDRERYPYVSIGLNIWSEITVICSASPFSADENGYITASGYLIVLYDADGSSAYFPYGDFSGSENCRWGDAISAGGVTHKTFWCNRDILDEDGSVYLASSDPIPVYE